MNIHESVQQDRNHISHIFAQLVSYLYNWNSDMESSLYWATGEHCDFYENKRMRTVHLTGHRSKILSASFILTKPIFAITPLMPMLMVQQITRICKTVMLFCAWAMFTKESLQPLFLYICILSLFVSLSLSVSLTRIDGLFFLFCFLYFANLCSLFQTSWFQN